MLHVSGQSYYARRVKRATDIAAGGTALALLSPVFGVCAVAIVADSGRPIFFRQERLGRDGKTISILKFRTMVDSPRCADREILDGDTEVTRIGRFLRRVKLDEVPQLWSVLKGDMSLVGPRPCLPTQLSELELNDDGRVRLLVRPGLTGFAQVNGNIYLSWPERWQYDRRYVEQLSFGLDVRIILRTLLVLMLGEHRLLKRP